jgi:hypothetical protein
VTRLALRPLGVFTAAASLPDPAGVAEAAALWEGDFTQAPWALTLPRSVWRSARPPAACSAVFSGAGG